MLTAERISGIYELLQKNNSVRVDELAQKYDVSEMTIRRDLEKMERDGMLERCHGGAVSKTPMAQDLGYDTRAPLNKDAKERIAQYCFEHYIQGNQVVYLDAGSTTLELAKLLTNSTGMTVVTNDIIIANVLRNCNLDVFMLGGKIQQSLGCIHGYIAQSQLEAFRMDVAFVSSLCADESYDVFAATENKVFFRRKLMECSQDVYMMMDDSKFHRRSLFRINNLSDYTGIVTNKEVSQEEYRKMMRLGIKWVTV